MSDDARVIRGAVRVEVPATSANLGPGFDCLGLALDWRDHCSFTVVDDPEVRVEVSGQGTEHLPSDGRNLIVTSLQLGLDRLGAVLPGGLHVRVHNTIPQGRGLGSSSAAIVAGLAGAHALVRPDEVFDPADWLPLADEIEGHPDNVAAALYGDLVLAYRTDSGIAAARSPVRDDIGCLALVPDTPVATTLARGVLPDQVPHTDAAANSGRAALLVHALTRDPQLLFPATADRLHQRYRSPSMPQSYRLLRSLREQGFPAVISGAGPTILVLGTAPVLAAAAGYVEPGFRPVRIGVGDGVRVVETGDL